MIFCGIFCLRSWCEIVYMGCVYFWILSIGVMKHINFFIVIVAVVLSLVACGTPATPSIDISEPSQIVDEVAEATTDIAHDVVEVTENTLDQAAEIADHTTKQVSDEAQKAMRTISESAEEVVNGVIQEVEKKAEMTVSEISSH